MAIAAWWRHAIKEIISGAHSAGLSWVPYFVLAPALWLCIAWVPRWLAAYVRRPSTVEERALVVRHRRKGLLAWATLPTPFFACRLVSNELPLEDGDDVEDVD